MRYRILGVLAIIVLSTTTLPLAAWSQTGLGNFQVLIRPSSASQNTLKVDNSTTPQRVNGGCEVDQLAGTTVNGWRITGNSTGNPPTISSLGCTNGGDASPNLGLAPAGNAVKLGGKDIAAPVAQTIGAYGVVAGTSNTAGANLIIQGGASTGNASGGNIIFQTTPPGASGTTQNTYTTALTLGSGGSASTFGCPAASGTNTAGCNTTLAGGQSTGNASGGSVLIQVSPSAASGSSVNALATAVTIADGQAPTSTFGAAAVASGQTNIAGGNSTVAAGQGTGSGVGGNVLVQVAYPGGSGTSNNTLGTVLTFNGTNNAASGTTVLEDHTPTINASGTNAYTAFRVNATETAQGSGIGRLLALSVGGTQRFAVTDGLSAVGTQIQTAQAVVPTCTTNCGSSVPAVLGSDSAMIVTLGTGPSNAFQINFNGTWTAVPACTVTQQTTAANYVQKALPSTTTVIVTTAAGPTASDKFSVTCLGTS